MAGEKRASSAPGNWFLLWGMVLIAILLAPAPEAAMRFLVARSALVVVAACTLIAAALWQSSGNDPARARAGFIRAAGALAFAAGLGGVGNALVIPIMAVRIAVLTVAGLCLLTSFVLDLAREAH